MNAMFNLAKTSLTAIVYFLFTILPPVVGQQQCQSGKYGVECRFDCHCNVTCDPIYGCTGQCASGWDGPTCQRQNVALHMQAQQSSNYSGSSYLAQNAVDGVRGHNVENTPCTHTAGSRQTAYWNVTLDQVYEIFGLRIYNRHEWVCPAQCGARLNGFILSVGNTTTNTYTACYRDQTSSTDGPGALITEDCQNGRTILGNSVKISLNTGKPLTLCEVEIFECTPGKFGPDCRESCGHCVLGRTVCNRASGNCPDAQPRCDGGYSGDQCKTVCGDLHWGPDCENSCGHCLNNAVCNKSSGVCSQSGCAAGYVGELCVTACEETKWGVGCTHKCGHCWNKTTCGKVTGECPLTEGKPRCSDGYLGEDCTQPCDEPKWGADCAQRCGYCWKNLPCDSVTGECPVNKGGPRCSAGYLGKDCTQPCSKGTWGENCQLTCSVNCKLGPTGCDVTSGECIEGCQEGYEGKYCAGSQVDYIPTIVGSVVGVIVAAFGLVLLVFFLRRYQRRSQNQAQSRQGRSLEAQENSVRHKVKELEMKVHKHGEMAEENTYETVFDRSYENLENAN